MNTINKNNKPSFLKTRIRLLAAFFILLFVGVDMHATHIVGGNITYRKIGPTRFEVTLTVRRDCFLGSAEAAFDDPASIGIFSDRGALQFNLGINGQILIPFRESDTLSNIVISDCGFEGTQVCVEEYRYIQEVDLPFRSGGYILGYQRCCRNSSLANIVDPLNTGTSYFVRIPESAFTTQNSSPVFNQWPPVYICANEALNFDHSATDPDGDSLVYKLCVPRSGASRPFPKPQPPSGPPYDEVQWQDPYDIDNLLGGVPLEIDPNTGVITGTPNTVGQFLVGICVEEWRDGELIGTVNRDFQYNVRVCSDPPTAIFNAPTENCDGLTVEFTNSSLSATDFIWNFDYPSTDPAFQSSEENPTFTFPMSGTYDVFLKVIRGTDQCNDSIIQTINVFDADFDVGFITELAECQSSDIITYIFTDTSKIDVPGVVPNAWEWTFTQNGVVQTATGNPVTIDLGPGDFGAFLEVTATNGCVGVVTKDLISFEDFDLDADFDVFLDGCSSDDVLSILLDDLSPGINPTYTVQDVSWIITTASGGTFTTNGDEAIIDIPRENFEVTVNITSNNGCEASVTKAYEISSFIPNVDFDFVLSECNGDNNPVLTFTETANDTTQFSTITSFNWLFNGSSASGPMVDYISQDEDSIDVLLEVTFGDGCVTGINKVLQLDEIVPDVNFTWQASGCTDDGTVDLQFTFDDSQVFGYGYDSIVWFIGTAGNQIEYVGEVVTATVTKNEDVIVGMLTNFDNACTAELLDTFYPGDFADITLVDDSLVLCPGELANLVDQSNPNFTYTWSPTTGLDLTDPANPILTAVSDLTYTVTVSDGLCTVEASIFVDVLESIDLLIVGDTTTCDGSVFLTATGGVGPGVYEWSTSSDFSTIIATNDTLITTFTGRSQSYFVRFNGEVCAANNAGYTVFNETPQVTFVSPFEFCVFDTVSFPLSNDIGYHDLMIVWDDDPHIVSGANTLNPEITIFPTDVDPFILTFTIINQFGCELKDTLEVQIGENPVVDIVYDVVNCDNYEVCFSIAGDFNGFPTWDLGDTTTTNDVFLIREICYTYPGPGTYEVCLNNISAVCPFEKVTKVITLRDSIPLFMGENIEACLGDEVRVPVPSGALGFDFSWCTLAGDSLTNADTLVVNASNDTSFVLKVIDENGCDFSDTISIQIFDFEYELLLPPVFCAGDTVDVAINVEGDIPYIYEWAPADCIVSGADTPTPQVAVTESKTLTVKVTHPTLGCMLLDSFLIEPSELVVEAGAEPDAEIFLGEDVTILVVDQMVGDTYQWSNGSTQGTQVVSPEETTTYTVTVTDEDGCTGVASVTITVIQPNCEEDVYLPNAFSPNGDEVNDVLFVRSNFVDEMQLVIYNRYNEEVFRSTDISVGWDGTFRGEPLSPDAFAFYLEATCVDGFTIKRQGNINLIR